MSRTTIICSKVAAVIGLCFILFNAQFQVESKKQKNPLEVVYAVNAGGEDHIDVHEIYYKSDPLKVGTESDYGKQLQQIGRVPQSDEILYQTERYHTSTFGYDVPLSSKQQDGEYVLILKFSEVYFNAPNMKVFDVVLNSDHTVVADLDIFSKVGKGTAHDEYVHFTVSQGKLYYKEEESEIFDGKIRIDFIKGFKDNPKINAFVLLKGNLDEVPSLPKLSVNHQMAPDDVLISQSHHDNIIDTTFEEEDSNPTKVRKTSGPKQPDPYQSDETSSLMLPVFMAIAAFIPLLFCLCKL